MMMALGIFVFSLNTLPYQTLHRTTQWRHPGNNRVGKRPSTQFLGPGEEPITLQGVLYPEITGGKISLALVRTMGNTGKAWPLIQGDGTIYGQYVIEEVDETQSLFFENGAARKIEFTIKLKRADDDNLEILGAITSSLLSLL